MANRWDERRDDYPGRGYPDRDRHDRGITERAGDEVRSWLGDDEAGRRRRMDEAREERDDREGYGRGRYEERGRFGSDQYGRNWSDRAGRSGERAWERTRDAARDMTDRDRDGRRGLDEWRDDDSWRERPYGASSGRYGMGAAAPRASWGSGGTPVRDRDFGDTSRYANADRNWTRTTYGSAGYSGAGDWRPEREWQGSYTGRGPRGYQRGDERIWEEVCDLLTQHPRIDASDVEVAVKGGEVTLSGSVRTREERRFTEDAIERVPGVRDVNNHLKVKPPDQVLGTARSGASNVLGLDDTPPPAPSQKR